MTYKIAQIRRVSSHPEVYEPCDDSFALVDGKGRSSFIYVSMAVVVNDSLWFINGRHSQRQSLAIF